ncbi:MAG: tetratricopeptide repeat protein [Myxococcota bacterium]
MTTSPAESAPVEDPAPACAAGDGAACTRLGTQYARGEGHLADPYEAMRQYRRACELGDARGCMFEAEAYRLGNGVLPDPAKPPELYGRACELGAGLGCRSVGDLVVMGAVVGAAPGSADAWYTRGCDLGDGQSCTARALAVERTHDTDASLALFARGCEGGHARACTLLGLRTAMGSDGAKKDADAAIGWFERGCATKPTDPESCRELGWARYRGARDDQAVDAAAGLLDDACYRNDTIACRYLARVERARGRTAEALMASERACDLGDEPACRLADVLRYRMSSAL